MLQTTSGLGCGSNSKAAGPPRLNTVVRQNGMPTLLEELRSLSVGVFLSARGIDSRVDESDLWRAFEQPVVIWAHGRDFDVLDVERLMEIVRKLPCVKRLRFTGGTVARLGVARLRETWPSASIEVEIGEPDAASTSR